MKERTAEELENSAPFDPDRRLQGEAGAAILSEMQTRLRDWERAAGTRTRQRKPDDQRAFLLTLDTLLANLIALWLNRVDATRFLAVSFDANGYRGSLSLAAMRVLRDALSAEGLIEVAPGFRKIDRYEVGKPLARRTRLRATPLLIEEFDRAGVGFPSLKRIIERGVVVIRDAASDAGPEPQTVSDSRPVLEALNARLKGAQISLPEDAFARLRAKRAEDSSDDYRTYAGDETAKAVYRIFSRSWENGGRIYGGWWMHLPAAERRHLLIDGEPVTEWDYRTLHPRLLFQRAGVALDFEPYLVPGLTGPKVRDLGKSTFQRLINRTDKKPMRAAKGDIEKLPPGLTFARYLALFTERLEPIAGWFSTGVGLTLQREDSDLAIAVIERMEARNVLVLPVHDSFIVQARWSEILRDEMQAAYKAKYGLIPLLKGSE